MFRAQYMAVADLGWHVGRRRGEVFVIAVDRDRPLELRCQGDEACVDVVAALQMAGWSGGQVLDPIDLLETAHMALYEYFHGQVPVSYTHFTPPKNKVG